jgi:hypothetical protein
MWKKKSRKQKGLCNVREEKGPCNVRKKRKGACTAREKSEGREREERRIHSYVVRVHPAQENALRRLGPRRLLRVVVAQ